MSNIKNIQPVIDRINENKRSTLLPRNWVKIISERIGKSETIVREWAKGSKNVPAGPQLVLKHQNQIIQEQKEQIQKLTTA